MFDILFCNLQGHIGAEYRIMMRYSQRQPQCHDTMDFWALQWYFYGHRAVKGVSSLINLQVLCAATIAVGLILPSGKSVLYTDSFACSTIDYWTNLPLSSLTTSRTHSVFRKHVVCLIQHHWGLCNICIWWVGCVFRSLTGTPVYLL